MKIGTIVERKSLFSGKAFFYLVVRGGRSDIDVYCMERTNNISTRIILHGMLNTLKPK